MRGGRHKYTQKSLGPCNQFAPRGGGDEEKGGFLFCALLRPATFLAIKEILDGLLIIVER